MSLVQAKPENPPLPETNQVVVRAEIHAKSRKISFIKIRILGRMTCFLDSVTSSEYNSGQTDCKFKTQSTLCSDNFFVCVKSTLFGERLETGHSKNCEVILEFGGGQCILLINRLYWVKLDFEVK